MRVTDKFVFFWGKQDFPSNFYPMAFRHEGKVFKWSEQAIMYRKAKHFGAMNIAGKVLQAKSPDECKKLGRQIVTFVESDWVAVRELIYKEVLLDKFSVPQLKQMLLKTEDKILVEASPFDAIWGIKMAHDHPDAENPAKWKGLNLLGKVLMEVRGELRG